MTLNDYKNLFKEQLNSLYGEETDALFAVVMDEVLGYSRADVVMNRDLILSAQVLSRLTDIAKQLQQEQPVQYVFERAYFYGYIYKVSPATLIPRRETEELVEWVLEEMNREPNKKWKVLDIGTGTGCIPITIKKEFPNAEVSAIDISSDALEMAKHNAKNNNADVRFIEQNILETTHLERYDIIISNPPYVRMSEKQEMKNNVLAHEPHLALFVENNDPLIFYRKIIQLAQNSLGKNGKLFFEINQYLGEEMLLLAKKYSSEVTLKKDLQQNNRMLKVVF